VSLDARISSPRNGHSRLIVTMVTASTGRRSALFREALASLPGGDYRRVPDDCRTGGASKSFAAYWLACSTGTY